MSVRRFGEFEFDTQCWELRINGGPVVAAPVAGSSTFG